MFCEARYQSPSFQPWPRGDYIVRDGRLANQKQGAVGASTRERSKSSDILTAKIQMRFAPPSYQIGLLTKFSDVAVHFATSLLCFLTFFWFFVKRVIVG